MRYELQRRMEDFDELLSQADSVQNTVSEDIIAQHRDPSPR